MILVNEEHLRKMGMVFGGCHRCGNNGWLVPEHGSPNRICTECLQRLDPAEFERITGQLKAIGEKA